MKLSRLFIFLALIVWITAVFVASSSAQEPAKKPPELPNPDIANGKYGEYAANTFDLWKAASSKRTPLVVYIHGGGLAKGDKSGISVNQLKEMLGAGLSVMAINYRLTGEAVFPQHYMDCARAIQ